MTAEHLSNQELGSPFLTSIAEACVVDLTHTIEHGMPVYPTHPQFFAMPWETRDPTVMNQLLIGEHTGTHLDSPSHLYPNPDDRRRITAADIPVDTLIGPAVKLDLAEGQLPTEVDSVRLRRWEHEYRPLQSGEAVVLHFGWARRWRTFETEGEYLRAWPGISRDAAEYLAEKGVRSVGTDCLSVDSSTSPLVAHTVLLEHGITIVENLCALELLPQDFVLITLPLKISGGSGSPVRAVAVLPGGKEARPERG